MADEMYCEVEDVTRYGASRGVLSNPARAISADAATDTFVWADNLLERNGKFEFVLFPGGVLPDGVAVGTSYYAIPGSAESRFQASLSLNGPAVSITTAGSKFGILMSLRETIVANIKAASQTLHLYLPAHAVPLIPGDDGRYPETPRRIVSIWSTHATCVLLGQRSALLQEEVDRLDERTLKLLLSGVPMRDTKDTSRRIGLSMSMGPENSRDEEYVP